MHSDWLIAGWEGALSVSAFDINYQLLTDSKSFYSGFRESRYALQNLIIVDSGEYETKGNIEGHFGIHPTETRTWSSAEFVQTVDNLDKELPALVVNMTFARSRVLWCADLTSPQILRRSASLCIHIIVATIGVRNVSSVQKIVN